MHLVTHCISSLLCSRQQRSKKRFSSWL